MELRFLNTLSHRKCGALEVEGRRWNRLGKKSMKAQRYRGSRSRQHSFCRAARHRIETEHCRMEKKARAGRKFAG